MTERAALLGAMLALVACDPAPAVTPDAGAPDDAPAPLDAPPDAPPPYAPDLECPGAPGCTGVGDGVLYAGVATVDITPVITICTAPGPDCTETLDVDVNGDGEFDEAEGDTFHDWNGNGRYDGVWMAGFGNARGATGVRDPQSVRAIALRWNDVTLVLASIDVIGWFKSEIDVVRERVAADADGDDVDFILVSATHVHQARDVIGIWGVTEDETGLDAAYSERVRAAATTAVLDAVRDLRPANLERWSVRLRDVPDGGVHRFISDWRDPNVFDDEVNLMRFVEAGTATATEPGTTIATLVNFGSHPECFDDDNTLLSSDFVHYLRVALEDGVAGPTGAIEPGLGGTAVFFQGALGSQIGPGTVEARAWDGTPLPRATEREAFTRAIGEQIGWVALSARRGTFPAGLSPTIDDTAALAVRTRSFLLVVENRRYHVAILQHIFDRPSFGWDMSRPISATNLPYVESEVSVLDIGGTQIITAPGELDPILFLGGLEAPYEYTPAGMDVVDTSRENAPDLTMRPAAPFVRDLARDDADQVLLFGLAQDFVGYLVPEFDYELDPVSPYYEEAPGEHYEETNSVGEHGWPTVRTEMEALLAWPDAP